MENKEKIIHLFNEKQLEFMKSLGIIITDKEYTDDEIIEINDKVADMYIFQGFDEEYNLNDFGKKCEEIVDIIGENL